MSGKIKNFFFFQSSPNLASFTLYTFLYTKITTSKFVDSIPTYNPRINQSCIEEEEVIVVETEIMDTDVEIMVIHLITPNRVLIEPMPIITPTWLMLKSEDGQMLQKEIL